ncbi:GntR family transcriptional regulator [Microbacterium telephonicum]|uniref:GntR family transcriptional regulator n=1 Tax=Microbacterium telephonicum TaxID=1714841 RepID=A0A498C7A2_9MICO|nr:GntR family transcriptional regulator [Microbacterium telephonicum]RLK48111.1 GntR family transcriptional regulator [Microbacterium telephonicum]
MTTPQVAAGSKSQVAYDWIRERIARHEFGPGYRLVLGAIAAELDMSVVPVREAIRRLEAEHLVTFEKNVGARVSVVDEDQYVHTMQTLGLLEGYATRLAAPHLTADDLAHAAEINARMHRLIDDFDPHVYTQLNQRFHAVLFDRCPNPDVRDLVERTWGRLAGLRDTSFSLIPHRPRHSVEEHDRILDLIRDGADPTELELTTRNHRLRTLDAFLDARHPETAHRSETT